MEFGSHTLTHPHLTELSDEALAQELAESRALLQARLGHCDTLAYPFGQWDARVARAVAAAGYRFAFGLPPAPRAGVTPLTIPRLPVDDADDARRFAIMQSTVGRRAMLSPSVHLLRQAKARVHQLQARRAAR
jgi:peptidoglycan/xylan/chitin deacetylase (PgdA/CDA1 family)